MCVCMFVAHADACIPKGLLQLDVRYLSPSVPYSLESGFSERLGAQCLPHTYLSPPLSAGADDICSHTWLS